jgi:hypothetical protein
MFGGAEVPTIKLVELLKGEASGYQRIGLLNCRRTSSPVVVEEMVRGTGFEPVTPTMSR